MISPVNIAKIIKVLTLLFLFSDPLLFLNSAEAKLIVKTVEYRDGDSVLEGKVTFDESLPGKRPGIVVVHDWTGLGKYVTSRIEQLANLGYVAFAADIYGKGIRPNDAQSSGKIAGSFKNNLPLLRKMHMFHIGNWSLMAMPCTPSRIQIQTTITRKAQLPTQKLITGPGKP